MAQSLAKSSGLAMAGILLSRFSGLFRSQLLSAMFGASAAMDAFVAAFRLPSALRDLLAEGALSAAFTKAFGDAKARGDEVAQQLVRAVATLFGAVTFGIAFLGLWWGENILVAVTDQSFLKHGSLPIAVVCFKVLVFYLPLAMYSSVAMSILSTFGKTFRATFAMAFFNVGSMIGALLFTPFFKEAGYEPILGLAYGTLLGGVLQFGYQAWPLLRYGFFPLPSLNFSQWKSLPELREIFSLLGPRVIAQGAATLGMLVNTYFASECGLGALTFISNAQIVILAPVGIFGVAAGFSSLPMLSEAARQKDAARFSSLLRSSIFSTNWLSLWSIIPFALLGIPFCSLVFEFGKYSRHDVIQTTLAINAYSISILFLGANKILQQGFFAFGDTRKVALIAIVSLIMNSCLSALFVPHWGMIGLGLASSITSGVNMFWNFLGLRQLHRKHFGESEVFLAAENMGSPRKILLMQAVFAFALGLLGLIVTKTLSTVTLDWHRFNFVLCLVFGGGLLGCIFVVTTAYFAPQPLQEALLKTVKKYRS